MRYTAPVSLERRHRIMKAGQFFGEHVLPLHLHYTTRSEMTGFHTHEFNEIAVVLAGTATYRTEFSTEPVGPGDVLSIPVGAGHAYTDEDGMEMMNVLFQFERLPLYCREIAGLPGFIAFFTLRPDYYRKMRYYPRVRLGDADLRQGEATLRWLYGMQTSQAPGREFALLGGFMQLVAMIANNFVAPVEVKNLAVPERIRDSIHHLHLHFDEPLDVATLARNAAMSQPSFYRHFKHATGHSPIEYLLAVRLNRAAEWLATARFPSVAATAWACGFEDSNYFARQFRRRFGISPSEAARGPELPPEPRKRAASPK